MPCPPDDALDQLILLADNGQLTDIEAWLGPYADEPDYAASCGTYANTSMHSIWTRSGHWPAR